METRNVVHAGVLLLALEGDEGTIVFQESVRSFANVREVTKIWIADLANPARNLRGMLPESLCMPSNTKDVVLVHLPNAAKHLAMRHLRDLALSENMFHVLVGQTHELLSRQNDGQAVEALPIAWSTTDVFQCPATRGYFPLADVFVDLRTFTFAGAVQACPVLLRESDVEHLTASAWPNVMLCVTEYSISLSRALRILDHARAEFDSERLDSTNVAKVWDVNETFLEHQIMIACVQARLHGEVVRWAQTRIDENVEGFAGKDGLLQAYILKLSLYGAAFGDGLKKLLKEGVTAAEIGLSEGRIDGIAVLSSMLISMGLHRLAAVLLSGATRAVPPRLSEVPWSCTPYTSTNSPGIRELLGVAFSKHPSRRDAAHTQFLAALKHPSSRFSDSTKQIYDPHALPGDNMTIQRFFPDLCNAIVPLVSVVEAFVQKQGLEALEKLLLSVQQGPGRAVPPWKWLLAQVSNLCQSLSSLHWGNVLRASNPDLTYQLHGPCVAFEELSAAQRIIVDDGFVVFVPVVVNEEHGLGLRVYDKHKNLNAVLAFEPGNAYVIRSKSEFDFVHVKDDFHPVSCETGSLVMVLPVSASGSWKCARS